MRIRHLIAVITGKRSGDAIAARAVGVDRLLGFALLVAIGLLVAGWLAPTMSVKRLLFLEERMSLLQGLSVLIDYGEYLLFAIVLIFSILFPLSRIYVSYRLWWTQDVFSDRFERRLRLVEGLGKWSMLDVFLIALVVAAINVSLIADVHLHWGLYMLSAGVLLSMATSTRLSIVGQKLRRGAYPARSRR